MANFNTINDVIKHLEGLQKLSDLKPEDYALENKIADKIARAKGDMKITQIRKFFGHIKKIESIDLKNKKDGDEFDLAKLYLLMPELAYSLGRGVINREFYDVMKLCLGSNKIKVVSDFKRFVELLTAVIAYSKMQEAEKKGGSR